MDAAARHQISGCPGSRWCATCSWRVLAGRRASDFLTDTLSPLQRLPSRARSLAYIVVLAGLSLLTGANGQISLGHGGFMAVGAYTLGLLMTHTGTNFVLELAAAAGGRRGGGRARSACRPPG